MADIINQTIAAAFRHRALGSLYQSSGVHPSYSSLIFIHEAKEGLAFFKWYPLLLWPHWLVHACLLALHTCCFHSGLILRQYFHTMFFMHSSRRSSEACGHE